MITASESESKPKIKRCESMSCMISSTPFHHQLFSDISSLSLFFNPARAYRLRRNQFVVRVSVAFRSSTTPTISSASPFSLCDALSVLRIMLVKSRKAGSKVNVNVNGTYLDETDIRALLTEALTANHEAVLADQTSRVRADAAVEEVSLAFFFPKSSPLKKRQSPNSSSVSA